MLRCAINYTSGPAYVSRLGNVGGSVGGVSVGGVPGPMAAKDELGARGQSGVTIRTGGSLSRHAPTLRGPLKNPAVRS